MISQKNFQILEKIHTQRMELRDVSLFSEKKTIRAFTTRERNHYARKRKQLPLVFFNGCFDKGQLKNLIAWYVSEYGEKITIDFLEILKQAGFHHATQAGISLGLDDLQIPPQKSTLISQATLKIRDLENLTGSGSITVIEKAQGAIDIWNATSESLRQSAIQHFRNTNPVNPIFMMAFSGARGNISQVRQLVGMRGLMADPQGAIIEFPIQSNFREGITLTEYLISCYGARKGLVDTALRTATTGYLTRRLVDTVQHIVVTLFDCQTKYAITVSNPSLAQRLIGRVLAKSYSKGGKKIGTKNQVISPFLAQILASEFEEIRIRSPLTCEASKPVCQLCYGWNLAHGKMAQLGDAVGVIAAQAIGEPGTQLTMRTFHTGGVGVFSEKTLKAIIVPFGGKVEFPNQLPGQFVRTTHGKIVYMLKYKPSVSSRLLLSILPKDPTHPIFSLTEQDLPVGSILFVKQGEMVQGGQIIAHSSQIRAADETMPESISPVRSPIEGELFIEYSRSFIKIKIDKDTFSTYRFIQNNQVLKADPFVNFYPPKFTQENTEGVFLPWTLCQLGRFWIFSSKIDLNRFTAGKSVIKTGDLISPQTAVFQNIVQSSNPKQIYNFSKTSSQLMAGLCFKNFNIVQLRFHRKGYCFKNVDATKISTCSNFSSLLWFPASGQLKTPLYQYFIPSYFQQSLNNFDKSFFIAKDSLFPQTSIYFDILSSKGLVLQKLVNDPNFIEQIGRRVQRLSENSILSVIPRNSDFDLFLKTMRQIRRKNINIKKTVFKILGNIEVQKNFKNNKIDWFFDIDKPFVSKLEKKVQNFLIKTSVFEDDPRVKAVLNFLREEPDTDPLNLLTQDFHSSPTTYKFETLSTVDRQQGLIKLFVEWSFLKNTSDLQTYQRPLRGLNHFIEMSSVAEYFNNVQSRLRESKKKLPRGSFFCSKQSCYKTQIGSAKIPTKTKQLKNKFIIFGDLFVTPIQSLQIWFWEPSVFTPNLQVEFGTLKDFTKPRSRIFCLNELKNNINGVSFVKKTITKVCFLSSALNFVTQSVYSDLLIPDRLHSVEKNWFYIPYQSSQLSLISLNNKIGQQTRQYNSVNEESSIRTLKKMSSAKTRNRIRRETLKKKIAFFQPHLVTPGKIMSDQISCSKPIRRSTITSSQIRFLTCADLKINTVSWYTAEILLKDTSFIESPLSADLVKPEFLFGYAFQTNNYLYYKLQYRLENKPHFCVLDTVNKVYYPTIFMCLSLLKEQTIPLQKDLINDWVSFSSTKSQVSVFSPNLIKQYPNPTLEKISPDYIFDFARSFYSSFRLHKNLFPLYVKGLVTKDCYQVQKLFSSSRELDQTAIPIRTIALFSAALFQGPKSLQIFKNNWIFENSQNLKEASTYNISGEILRFDLNESQTKLSILRDEDLLTIGFSTPFQYLNTMLGRQIRSGTKITEQVACPWSGQIIKITPQTITLRRGLPFLASNRGLLAISPNQLIRKDDLLVMLKSRRLQTEDIVQGIPKIEQLFEARSTQDGQALRMTLKRRLARSFWKLLLVNSVDRAVSESIRKLQYFLVENIVGAYSNQGVQISEKHVEIVVREMTDHIRINNVRGFVPGELMSWSLFKKFQKKIFPGPRPVIPFSDIDEWQFRPAYQPVVLGITKTVLQSPSFLLAASFQEVNRVLIGSSLTARRDFLRGLHENIITSLAIPAGTGLVENPRYSHNLTGQKIKMFTTENRKQVDSKTKNYLGDDFKKSL